MSENRSRSKDKESEWQERVIQIRRVSKVVKGGKKLSFRAIVVVGNRNGSVGVGTAKASDVIGAVKKAVANGHKSLITIPLTKGSTIHHPINGIFGAATVIMRPSAPGSGVIAGGAVRTVLELAGIKNILSKQLGSDNYLNNARAALNGLNKLTTFKKVAQLRDIPLEQVLVN